MLANCQTLADLLALRELLTSPDHWTRGALARDSVGNAVTPCLASAKSWCLLGGTCRVVGDPAKDNTISLARSRSLSLALEKVIQPPCCGPPVHAALDAVVMFNDARDTTHATILDAIDRAIADIEQDLHEDLHEQG